MTMRDEFEANHQDDGDPAKSAERFAWIIWQAAYRPGQEEMRERAAKAAWIASAEDWPDEIADRIRALPLDA